MNREQLIEKLKQSFNIKELVCNHCYTSFKDKSWLFLSTELLNILYTLRYIIFNKPIIINTWAIGGKLSQRGLRCNLCLLVKDKSKASRIYLSAHCMGKAIDFNVEGLTTQLVKDIIRLNKDKFEYPIRLEANTTTWCHVDVFTDDFSHYTEFNG